MAKVHLVVRRAAIRRNIEHATDEPCIEIWHGETVTLARIVDFTHGRLRQDFLRQHPHGAQVYLEVEAANIQVIA